MFILPRLRRWIVFGKLALAVLFPVKLTSRQLKVYNTPPSPPDNSFVRGKTATINNNSNGNNNNNGRSQIIRHPPPIWSYKLIEELLLARMQACISLGNYMRNSDSQETAFLVGQGGRVPDVVA